MNTFQRIAAITNRAFVPLMRLPVLGPALGRSMTVISYTGRRSGATFELPVSYRRSDEKVTIRVALPDQKSWWRNFTGDGGPLTLTLDGNDRHGHATAQRDDKGAVTVRVVLDPA